MTCSMTKMKQIIFDVWILFTFLTDNTRFNELVKLSNTKKSLLIPLVTMKFLKTLSSRTDVANHIKAV